MHPRRLNLTAGLTVAALALVLTGCSSRSLTKAPVEDRGTAARSAAPSASPVSAPTMASKPLPGAEHAGKPGFYTVKPGDTLIRIGLDSGQNWRDIGRWNNLDNPNVIEVGQVLRVTTPGGDAVVARPITNAPTAVGSPLPPQGTAQGATQNGSKQAEPVAPPVAPSSAKPAAGEDDVAWIWPAQGVSLAGFDEAKNKGLDIAGRVGDPVLAAADGRVVYAGSGLRGYGNLVILKHNNTFLTAYAHNQTLLVKEDQNVKQGQKIAEMGSTDSDRVKLHFEIRRQGKPVDPSKYLPPR